MGASLYCRYTKNIGNTIQPYWVMWVDTVLDFYDFTGDLGTVRGLAPWVEQRLDHADFVATSGTSASLRWSRDDDRMGFGFESPDKPEARRAFLALLVGASKRYVRARPRRANSLRWARLTALLSMPPCLSQTIGQ